MRELLPAAYRDTATVAIHDPDARDNLSYLAGADDEPIYLNRLLTDADVVLPIGCLRCEPAIDYHGMFGGLFPTFSGRQTQDKLFADRRWLMPSVAKCGCREKIQEAGWLLGVQFTVQVVPGPGGEVLRVLAGMPADVFQAGQAACQEAWSCAVPRPAQLVIAAIDGPAAEQTWDNVARALANARRVVRPMARSLCTSLDSPAGPNAVPGRRSEGSTQGRCGTGGAAQRGFAGRRGDRANTRRVARLPDEPARRSDRRRVGHDADRESG